MAAHPPMETTMRPFSHKLLASAAIAAAVVTTFGLPTVASAAAPKPVVSTSYRLNPVLPAGHRLNPVMPAAYRLNTVMPSGYRLNPVIKR